MCCAIKPTASWLLEETVSICRERCGGQGYLSCNRFGTFLGLAHAAMTAEGDNSVLMQKVAKERLGMLAKNPPKLEKPSSTNLKDTNYLVYLLKARELNLFNELGTKMKKAGKAGTYDSWMFEESDLIQHASKSFADSLIAERFVETLKTCDSSLTPVLSQVLDLYLTTVIEKNLGWFIISGILQPNDVSTVRANGAELCALLGPQALALCESFGITDTMLSAPIALDWVGYNTYDNQGEVMSEKEWNETVREKK